MPLCVRLLPPRAVWPPCGVRGFLEAVAQPGLRPCAVQRAMIIQSCRAGAVLSAFRALISASASPFAASSSAYRSCLAFIDVFPPSCRAPFVR